MSEFEAVKESIIRFIKSKHEATGSVPTIATICKQIKGVSRSSFYKYFPQGIGEACGLAGVPSPIKRIVSTAKATETRVTDKKIGQVPKITLTQQQSKDLSIWGLIEDKDPLSIINELLENTRILKKQYNLNLTDMARLASLLKEGEKIGLTRNRLLICLKRFKELGLYGLSNDNFDLLISLRNDMIKNGWSFIDLMTIRSTKEEMYKWGYMKCIEDAVSITSNELEKYVSRGYLREFDNIKIANEIKIKLLLGARA